MTRCYTSEEEAITWGIYFAGKQFVANPNWKGVKVGEIDISQFGCNNHCNLYEIHNTETKEVFQVDGENVQFAIGPFRSGFELWLLGYGGSCVRT